MAELIAIGYPDETTAGEAEKEAHHLADELIIQPDAIASIVRDKDGKFRVSTSHHAAAVRCMLPRKDGKFRVSTSHHAVGAGASYGMFWGFLFGLLFFVPVL